jgi:hypothetical protein
MMSINSGLLWDNPSSKPNVLCVKKNININNTGKGAGSPITYDFTFHIHILRFHWDFFFFFHAECLVISRLSILP